MSALNEQRPKIWIAFLGDVQLRLTTPRVAACRLQTDEAARIAALRETMRIFESQEVGQRYQRTHAMDLGQERHFGIRCLPEFDDLAVVLTDLLRKCLDGYQNRFHRGTQSRAEIRADVGLDNPAARSLEPFSVRLHQSASRVDESGSRSNERSTRTYKRQVCLCLCASMSHLRKKFRIDSCKTDGTTPTTSSTEYSGAFMVDSSTTIEAIAVAPGYSNSAVATTTYTINIPPAAATPTFLPASGTYPSAQNVTISDATMGAKIYYTTDGSTPSSGSTLYSAPIVVNVTKTINAIAMASGYRGSAVASAAYTINIPSLTVATPTFSPAAGTYTSAQSVMIADSTAGAVIYYTTDGSAPTPSSTKYTGAITVASTETINAIATASGDTNSAVATATYTINLPAPTFTLAASPTSATINSGQSATFTLTVTPQNGFAQVVNFSCAGLPSGDSCSFSPSSITPVGAAITSTMTIAPATSATSLPLWEKTVGGLTLALLFWPMRRRRVWPVLALTILLAVAMVVTACGGSPKSQVYSITVTAAGGSVSQSASITLTSKN